MSHGKDSRNCLNPTAVNCVLAFVRSGFCAFWLFLRQALILGFDLPVDSPEYTRQPNDSSPKALTLDLLRFGYKFERYRLREISQTEVQA